MVTHRRHVELPATQADQVADLRDALIQRTREALETLQPSVRADATRAIDRIVASGYDERTVKREIRQLVRGHFARIRTELAVAIEDAVGLAARYREHMAAWEADALARGGGVAVSPSRAAFGIAYGDAGAGASTVGHLADLPKRKFKPKTDADKFLKANIRPWREKRKLSTRLHTAEINARRESIRLSMRAVREGRVLQANNDLILGLARRGHTVGGANELPGYLKKFEQAGNNLMQLQRPSPRDKEAVREYKRALKEWRTQRDIIKRKVKSELVEGGRVQGSLIELLQRTSDDNVGRMRRALDVFVGQKQSYYAERILDTELHSAYRSAQVRQDMRVPEIVGYIWRLQRDARSSFESRVKPRKIKLASGRRTARPRRCICESMAGRRLSKEALQEYPQGGHPHCMCWFEPVYDRTRMRSRRLSQADRELLGEFDD